MIKSTDKNYDLKLKEYHILNSIIIEKHSLIDENELFVINSFHKYHYDFSKNEFFQEFIDSLINILKSNICPIGLSFHIIIHEKYFIEKTKLSLNKDIQEIINNISEITYLMGLPVVSFTIKYHDYDEKDFYLLIDVLCIKRKTYKTKAYYYNEFKIYNIKPSLKNKQTFSKHHKTNTIETFNKNLLVRSIFNKVFSSNYFNYNDSLYERFDTFTNNINIEKYLNFKILKYNDTFYTFKSECFVIDKSNVDEFLFKLMHFNSLKYICLENNENINITLFLSNKDNELKDFISVLKKYSRIFNVNFELKYSINNSLPVDSSFIVLNFYHEIPDIENIIDISFKEKGELIFLLGETYTSYCHEYKKIFKQNIIEQSFDFSKLSDEYKINDAIKQMVSKNMISSLNQVSDKGLLYSLLQSALKGNYGFDITTHSDIESSVFLFSDKSLRYIATVNPNNEEKTLNFLIANNVPFTMLGHVTKEEIRIDDISLGFISDIRKMF